MYADGLGGAQALLAQAAAAAKGLQAADKVCKAAVAASPPHPSTLPAHTKSRYTVHQQMCML
jgi:hypothetical protein